MATGQFTGFPINWSDVLGSFGLVGAAGGTFTGGVTFAGPQPTWSTAASRVSIGTSAGFPAIQWMHSAGGADAKGWDAYANGNSLVFRTLNDAATAAVNWLEVVRSGTSISHLVFNGNHGFGLVPSKKLHGLVSVSTSGFDGLLLQNESNTASLQLGITGSAYSYAGVPSSSAWLYTSATTSLYLGPDGGGSSNLVSNGAVRLTADANGSVRASGPLRTGQYTLSTLPSASVFSGHLIDVTNATGGPKLCRSNGSVWQILNTTTTVS